MKSSKNQQETIKSKKHTKAKVDSDVDETELKDDYMIKPSNEPAKLDTADWPFLLKVYLIICTLIIIHLLELP